MLIFAVFLTGRHFILKYASIAPLKFEVFLTKPLPQSGSAFPIIMTSPRTFTHGECVWFLKGVKGTVACIKFEPIVNRNNRHSVNAVLLAFVNEHNEELKTFVRDDKVKNGRC